jgi:hypothetical protein
MQRAKLKVTWLLEAAPFQNTNDIRVFSAACLGRVWVSPRAQIETVEDDAEQVCGDETELRRPETDDANDEAVNTGQHPSFPISSANQDGWEDREHARKIVKPQHDEVNLLQLLLALIAGFRCDAGT